jgi:hypothetical protein
MSKWVEMEQATVENECTCSFSAWLDGGAGKEPTAVENEQLHSFWWWLGSVTGTGLTTIENEHTLLVFGSGLVVVLARNQLPSKMSNYTRFRGQMVVVRWWCRQRTNRRRKRAYLLVFSIGWVVVLARNQPLSKTSNYTCFKGTW